MFAATKSWMMGFDGYIEVPVGIAFARLANPEGNVIGLVRRPN